jgi:V/A-type H+-transporting ATPase subunit K
MTRIITNDFPNSRQFVPFVADLPPGDSDTHIENDEEDFMDPQVFVPLGAGLAIGLTALATGWAHSRIGAAGAGVIAEKPEMVGSIILLIAIPETMVVLGFAVAAMTILLT